MSDDFDDDFGNDFEGNIDNFDDLIEETNDNQQKREIDFNEFISQTLENYIEVKKYNIKNIEQFIASLQKSETQCEPISTKLTPKEIYTNFKSEKLVFDSLSNENITNIKNKTNMKFLEMKQSVLLHGISLNDEMRENYWSILTRRNVLNAEEFCMYVTQPRRRKLFGKIEHVYLMNALDNYMAINEISHYTTSVNRIANVFMYHMNELSAFYCSIGFYKMHNGNYMIKEERMKVFKLILESIDKEFKKKLNYRIYDECDKHMICYTFNLYTEKDNRTKLMDFYLATSPSFALLIVVSMMLIDKKAFENNQISFTNLPSVENVIDLATVLFNKLPKEIRAYIFSL